MPTSHSVISPFRPRPLLLALLLLPLCSQADTRASTTEQQEQILQEEAREREETAIEDPMQKMEVPKQQEEEHENKESYIKPFGSVRVHTRSTNGTSYLSDSASRIGVDGLWSFSSKTSAFFRLEAGIDVLNELDKLFSNKTRARDILLSDILYKRLALVGLETPTSLYAFGKMWSSYYKVAYFTDRFDVDGGHASGAYNAGTDGGQTGTGRANMALQTRQHFDVFPDNWNLKPLNLSFQLQNGQPIPNVDNAWYGTAFDLSAIITTHKDLAFGLAYNYAVVANKANPAVVAARIRGDAQALLLGLRVLKPRWYFGATLSRTLNHFATSEFKYYSAVGLEIYSHYDITERINLVAGLNDLRPDKGQDYVGKTRTRYLLLGLRYMFDELHRYIYTEMRLDDTLGIKGTRLGNSISFGVRWDFR